MAETDDEGAKDVPQDIPQGGPRGANTWENRVEPQHVNVMQAFGGPFDVTLVFGQQDLTSSDGTRRPQRTREIAELTMSWGHLKSMIPLLAKLVANYEQQVGEMPSPGFDQAWKE